MLANQKIIDAYNRQTGNELHASHQYIAIASYFAKENLEELSKFFLRQSAEENEHAMKFVHFILDVGGDVVIPQIDAPRTGFASAHDAVAAALAWEEEVTRQIYELVDLARSENHYVAERFLDWFVDEQLEEVNLMSTLLGVVDRAGEDNLLYVEDYLARRGVSGPETVSP